MKCTLLLAGLLYFVSSCSQDEKVNSDPPQPKSEISEMSDEELEAYAESIGAITMDSLMSWIKAYEAEHPIKEEVEHRNRLSELPQTRAQESEIIYVYGYSSKSDEPIPPKNRKTIIRNSPTGMADGVYFCNLYNVAKMVYLPEGALGVGLPSPNCGLDPNAIGGGSRGFSFSQTGNKFYMRTIGYVIEYDITGINWGRWDPPLNSLEYRYKYFY